MGNRIKIDLYLKRRGDSWVYCRRVPATVASLDSRAPTVRQALGTRDLAVARQQRDLLAAADDELWASLFLNDNVDHSRNRYAAALNRVKALGFGFVPTEVLSKTANWEELSRRLEAIMPTSTPPEVEDAVLGVVEQPKDRYQDALRIYMEGPGKKVIADMSPNQFRIWSNIPKRAIRRFVEVVGDKPLAEISRSDAVCQSARNIDPLSASNIDPLIAMMS